MVLIFHLLFSSKFYFQIFLPPRLKAPVSPNGSPLIPGTPKTWYS